MTEIQTTKREIYIFDSTVPDIQKLIAAIGTDQRIIILDSSGEGVLKLADALMGESNLDAINFIAHGAAGTFYLDNTVITDEYLGYCSSTLSGTGAALCNDRDILYGCDLANGSIGHIFIEQSICTRAAADSFTVPLAVPYRTNIGQITLARLMT